MLYFNALYNRRDSKNTNNFGVYQNEQFFFVYFYDCNVLLTLRKS